MLCRDDGIGSLAEAPFVESNVTTHILMSELDSFAYIYRSGKYNFRLEWVWSGALPQISNKYAIYTYFQKRMNRFSVLVKRRHDGWVKRVYRWIFVIILRASNLMCAFSLISERELTFTFAICYRPSVYLSSVCRLSVCNVRAPYSGGSNFSAIFLRH